MDDLIEALQIFKKYTNEDVIMCVKFSKVSKKDKLRLEELSFIPDGNGQFHSYRFGSC